MKTMYKNKMFLSSIVLSLLALLSVFFVGASNVFAANPQFNFMSSDIKTLRLGNYSTEVGTYDWKSTLTANPGQRIAADIYYHNGVEGTIANNTRLRVTFPTTASNRMTISGTILSSNATQVNDTATLDITSSQTITPEVQARWLPNQQTTGGTLIPVTNNGNSIEVNIGNVAGGWATQGHVIFYFNISNTTNPNNNISVDAGTDVTINEGQTTNFSARVLNPNNLVTTLTWTCTGGSLSNPSISNPVYTAPLVNVATTYVCTLNARDTAGNTGSDSLNVTVLNIAGPNDPVVSVGPNLTVNEGQTVNLSATATDPNGLTMAFTWNCNGGSLSSTNTLNTVYTAPFVDANTTYSCTFVARDTAGNTGSAALAITVINTGANGGGGGGGASPSISVTLSASPTTGLAPLNGVDLIATAYTWGISDETPLTYRFDCEGDNAFELIVQTTDRSYIAHDLCNYYYDGLYTAKVKVEANGFDAWNQATIRVGAIPGGGTYGIFVDAGSNKDIGENQSTVLYGYAYSQFSNVLNYYWTCNGGSLSNALSLTPTYYAPSVNVDTTYSCTLFVTDGRGFKNSDSVNIVVRNNGGVYSTGLQVTTNYPESIDKTSAVLKGTLDNAGGPNAAIRFSYGKGSTYTNSTDYVYNQPTGKVVTVAIYGLEKGKAYHYRAEARNPKETVMGQDVAFITKPDSTSGFSATAAGSGQISLSWNRGNASCYTLVLRKTGSYPANSADGVTVYYGTGTSVLDRNLSNDVWYYYKAWAVGCDQGLYSYSDSQYARAYTEGASTYVPPVQTETENGISVDALVRDTTQNEIAWQNSITASPSDELEFKIVITPTGDKSLENVALKTALSEQVGSIDDIKIDNESYSGSLSDAIKLGTIALGESKVITFKGKVSGRDNFSYGSNEITNAFEVTADNNTAVKKTITIDVLRGTEAEAGLLSLIDMRAYAGILTILFIILLIIVMYLLIERRRDREALVEKAASTKVEKSKYFNIK